MADDAGSFGLTRAQQLMWAGQRLHPEAPLYNQAFTFEIAAGLDADLLERAFRRLIERCDSLRTVIEPTEDGPRQRVVTHLDFVLPVVDLASEPDPVAAARSWAEERCQQPFDPGTQLFDAALLRTSSTASVLYLCQHHVVTDAWSMAVLFRQLDGLYRSLADQDTEPPAPPAFMASYARLEAEHRTHPPAPSVEHWRGFAEATTPPPRLYGRRPPIGTASERLTMELGETRHGTLLDFARRPEVGALTLELGLFQVLATMLFAWQHRVSGQRDLTLGAPSHHRSSAELRRTAGLLTEVLPMRVEVSPQDSFAELLAKVRTETLEFLRHAYPGAGEARQNRGLCAVLNFIRGDFGDFAGADTTTRWLHPGHHDREHPIRLHAHDFTGSGRLKLHLDVNFEMGSAEQRRRIVDHLLALLDAMMEDASQPIGRVALLDAAERNRLLAAGRGPRPAPRPWRTVIEHLVETARSSPRASALLCGDRVLTYGELATRVTALARKLETYGPRPRVALAMKRSPEAVIGLLATLAAGGAYVPLDPAWPRRRLEWVMRDAGVTVALTAPQMSWDASPDTSLPSISLEAEDPTEESDAAIPTAAADPDATAYLIYTSGSTGQPKGVAIPHRALANYVAWASAFYGGFAEGRAISMPLFSPLTFDLTVTSLFVPLATGGEVVIYPETGDRADLALLDVVREDRVDALKLTPSHLALLAGHGSRPNRLRQLILGGESLRREAAQRAVDLFGPEVAIHNEYGPTEATVGCVIHTFDAEMDTGTAVPIGVPIDGLEAHVLDPHLEPVPEGVVGELYLGGEGLADGYLGRPELDAERFLDAPPDFGNRLYRSGDLARWSTRGDGRLLLDCLGRVDDQVKIRGARLELGEIEAALLAHPGIEACAAGVYEGPAQDEDRRQDPRRCRRCGLPEDHPNARLAADDICDECRAFESYRHKVDSYFRDEHALRALLDAGRPRGGDGYDCLVLLSGGKDSTYVLCRLVHMGYRPLAFTLDNGFISEQAKGNIRRVCADLGVDHHFASTPAMNNIFKDSLERFSNVCQGCFKTIYTLAIREAKDRRIPFVITGLSRGQLFETRLTRELFTELDFDPERIDRTVLEARRAYHRADDAVSRLLDVSLFEDDRIFDEVRLVDFYRYCDVSLQEMLEELDRRVPWIRPTDTGRSTNCLINDLGIAVHKRERGFHNYAHPYAWDVRLGHKTRQAALEELDDDLDPGHIEAMLDEIGYAPKERRGDRRLVAHYQARPGAAPTREVLRTFLAERLPAFMVPSAFVAVDEMPLTAHGKVDRGALPAPDSQMSGAAGYVAPRGGLETTLAGLWAEVLRIERVGARDNFFELGGDSILAIQIVARGHRRGLEITPEQLFDTLTVEKLAKRLLRDTPAAVPTVPLSASGPAALLPAQLWFLERPAARHHHLVEVEIEGTVQARHLDRALSDLARRHDALRQRFWQEDGVWRSECVDQVEPRLHRAFEASRTEALEGLLGTLDHRFIEGDAGLFGALLVDADSGTQRLLLAAHHLIVDAVSWGVLLDELADDLQALKAGGETAATPASSPRRWALALEEEAGSPRMAAELDFWRRQLPPPGGVRPPMARTAGEGASETGGVVRIRLGAEATRRLLQDVTEKGRTRVQDVLVAALAASLEERRGAPATLWLEGHGRGALDRGTWDRGAKDRGAKDRGAKEQGTSAPESTGGVGWLSCLYPLRVPPPRETGSASWLLAAKDALRAVPRGGAGYGLLRYLGDPESRRVLEEASAGAEAAGVLFNYLGQAHALASAGDLLRPVRPLELIRDAGRRGTGRFALEVVAWVGPPADGGSLEVEWIFQSKEEEAEIERLAGGFLNRLEALISQGRDATPHADDFPLAKLDARKMAKLSAVLGRRGS